MMADIVPRRVHTVINRPRTSCSVTVSESLQCLPPGYCQIAPNEKQQSKCNEDACDQYLEQR